MTTFVKTGWIAPLIELVESRKIVEGDGGMILDTVVEKSIALETGFGVFAGGRIDVETRKSNQSVCKRRSNKYTGSTVSLVLLVEY